MPNAGGFQFSKGSEWLAIKMTGAPNDTSHRGTDLLLRRLSTGTTQNIGNVNQYDFDDAGKLLAYTVDASSRLGNGVYLLNLGTGEMRALDGAAKDYDGLTWAADSTRLAVLRGEKPEGKVEKENALLAWTDAGAAQPQVVEWDPAKDAAFPQGFVLSEYTAPRWTKDGARVFVGIKAQEDSRSENGEPQANLDIYHWKDVELQSEQIIRVGQARRATFAGVVTVASKKFLKLADDTIRTVTPTSDDRWAIGRDSTPYDHDFSEGQPSRGDYYKIDTTTGARTLIAKAAVANDGHVARQPLVPVPREPARDGLQPGDRQGRAGRHGHRRISSTPTTTSRRKSRSGAWPAGRRTASRSCSTTSTTSGRSRSTAARARI